MQPASAITKLASHIRACVDIHFFTNKMKRTMSACCVLLLLATSVQALFDPLAHLRQQVPSFTVTHDSNSAEGQNDACTGASEYSIKQQYTCSALQHELF